MRGLAGVIVVALALIGTTTAAQPAPPARRVDTMVAKALFDQAVALMQANRFVEARRLFEEAVARDPRGPAAARARELAAACAAAAARQPAGVPRGGPPPVDGPDPYGDDLPPLPPLPPPPPSPAPAAAPAAPPPVRSAPPAPLPLAGWRAEQPGYSATWAELQRGRERRRARVQVAVGLGVWGLYAGPVVGLLACDSHSGDDCAAGVSLGAVGGPAVGVGLAMLLSSSARYGEGQAMATVAGMWWGFWNGLAFSATRRDPDALVVVRDALLGSSAGIAVGALVGLTRPTTGQVALANSFAGYAAVGAALLTVLGQPRHGSDYGRNAMIAANGALVLGYLVGNKLGMTRARAALLDVGGAAGATLGAVASLAFTGKVEHRSADQDRLVAGLAAGGLVAGVLVAWVMTADMKARPRGPRLAAFPALIAHDDDGWGLGAPAPRPVVSQAADGRRAMGAAVDVVGGTF